MKKNKKFIKLPIIERKSIEKKKSDMQNSLMNQKFEETKNVIKIKQENSLLS